MSPKNKSKEAKMIEQLENLNQEVREMSGMKLHTNYKKKHQEVAELKRKLAIYRSK